MSKQEEKQEDKYEIVVENTEDFRELAVQDFITTTELCQLFNPIFKAAFDDFEGLTAEVFQGNVSLTAYFNRLEYGPDALTAFSKNVETSVSNEALARYKRFNRVQNEGLKYHITKEGKEALTEFLSMNSFQRNSKNVNWNQITGDQAEPVTPYQGQPKVYSVVKSIDPIRLLAKVYGKKDGDNDYEYKLDIVSSKVNAFGAGTPEFVLSVTRINKKELDRALRNAGISNFTGLGIVK